jgi:hypothetical protein
MDKSAAILIVDDYLLIRTHVRQVLAELALRTCSRPITAGQRRS